MAAGYRFKISDQSPADNGDMVVTAGIDFERYRANPVVFLNHNLDVPVGMSMDPATGEVALEVDAAAGEVHATVWFAPTALGREAERLVRAGELAAASIHAFPHQTRPIRGRRGALLIERSTMVEWSLVREPGHSKCWRAERPLWTPTAVAAVVRLERRQAAILADVRRLVGAGR